MEKETRLTIHGFGGAKLLELRLHWRVWPHVAGLHPALIRVPSDKDWAAPLFKLPAGTEDEENLALLHGRRFSLPTAMIGTFNYEMLRACSPTLHYINGSLHEICEGALVQKGLLYVVLTEVLHHIYATRL